MEKEIDFLIEKKNDDIIFTPKEKHLATVIWLPGYKDSAASYYEDVLDERRPNPRNVKIYFLTAPKVIPNDPQGWSWYKTISREAFKVEGLEENIKRITDVIDFEASLLNGDYSKIFLGGFSQGSLMTFLVGLNIEKEKTLGGLICCSGYLCCDTKIRNDDLIKKMPILVCHGKRDERIIYEYALKSQKEILGGDFNITYKVFDIEHELTWDVYKEIKEFLSNCLQLN